VQMYLAFYDKVSNHDMRCGSDDTSHISDTGKMYMPKCLEVRQNQGNRFQPTLDTTKHGGLCYRLQITTESVSGQRAKHWPSLREDRWRGHSGREVGGCSQSTEAVVFIGGWWPLILGSQTSRAASPEGRSACRLPAREVLARPATSAARLAPIIAASRPRKCPDHRCARLMVGGSAILGVRAGLSPAIRASKGRHSILVYRRSMRSAACCLPRAISARRFDAHLLLGNERY
jgi:hypothetical protein